MARADPRNELEFDIGDHDARHGSNRRALHALKPQPAIVRPVVEAGESLASFKMRTDAQIEAAENAAAVWMADGSTVREQVSARFQAALGQENLAPAIVEMLDRMIVKIEEVSREGARDFDEMERSFKRQIKQARRLQFSDLDVIEKLADRSMLLMQRELEERSDMVLFLKSWRSEFSSGGQGGPNFDDPDALDRYLREAASA